MMFTGIQRGDTVWHKNGSIATAASGVGFNSCGYEIISARYPDSEGGFYIPWYVALIVRVERRGYVVWDADETPRQMTLWEVA